MGEGSAVVWAAGISAFGAFVLSVLTAWRVRKKDNAEANAITSTEWKRLYDEMCRRLKKQDARLDEMDHQLDIAKDYIQYLWVGTTDLSNQVRGLGEDPVFKPKRNFRGSDDFNASDWAWLGDTK